MAIVSDIGEKCDSSGGLSNGKAFLILLLIAKMDSEMDLDVHTVLKVLLTDHTRLYKKYLLE